MRRPVVKVRAPRSLSRISFAPPGLEEFGNRFHGIRSVSPMAKFRRPVGASQVEPSDRRRLNSTSNLARSTQFGSSGLEFKTVGRGYLTQSPANAAFSVALGRIEAEAFLSSGM